MAEETPGYDTCVRDIVEKQEEQLKNGIRMKEIEKRKEKDRMFSLVKY